MAINKVIYQGKTLINITDSTVTSDNLEAGLVAYAANGERVVGTKTTLEGEVNLSFKEFTNNGSYYAKDFGVDGFSGVNINVEKPEGTIQITENGTHNVSGKEFAEVDVKPLYDTFFIWDNGKFNVTDYNNVEVNVGDYKKYDLSNNTYGAIRLKAKIPKPTDRQKERFDENGGIFYVPFDVEHISVTTFGTFLNQEVAEGVTFQALHLQFQLGSSVNPQWRATLFYIWEEDIAVAQEVLMQLGLNGSVTSEGWYVLNSETSSIRLLSEEELREELSINTCYDLVKPYGDYWESLLDFYATHNSAEPADVISASDLSSLFHTRLGLLTKNNLCERDIMILGNVTDSVAIYKKPDGDVGYLEHVSNAEEYHDYTYMNLDIIGDEVIGVTYHTYTLSGYENVVYLGDFSNEKKSFIFCSSPAAITLTGKMGKVYTNATIVSQSDNEVFISGIRHNTYILILN